MLRRTFARFAFVLVVAATATPAFALDRHALAATEPGGIETVPVEAASEAPASRPGNAPARSKYVHSVRPSSAGGGNDGDDSGMVRSNARNSKWHSYLPGMFR